MSFTLIVIVFAHLKAFPMFWLFMEYSMVPIFLKTIFNISTAERSGMLFTMRRKLFLDLKKKRVLQSIER